MRSRGLIIVLPDSSRGLVTTSDSSAAVTQRLVDLRGTEPTPDELRLCLAIKNASNGEPIQVGSRLVGMSVEQSPEGEAPAESQWSRLVAATLPQVYAQEESFVRRKLEAMAEFAAGAGHEINNPAATIVGRAGQLLRGETDPDRRRHLATIGAQAYRIRDMIGDAMLFARPPRPALEQVDVGAILTEAIASLEGKLTAKRLTVLREEGSIPLSVSADRTQLVIVCCELLRNSTEASANGSEIEVAVDCVEVDGHERVEIRVSDSGKGMTDIEREHLFDPFFSGRQAGRGLGFGLPKAWRIVQQHGGTLTLETRDASGTTFVVRLPAGSTPADAGE